MSLVPLDTILLVEDDRGHAILLTKALRRAYITNPITTLHDGQDAVDCLCATGSSTGGAPALPLLMLLDLRLPGLDGLHVLQWVRANRRTSSLPVILVSAVDAPPDLDQCVALGCRGVLTKPAQGAQVLDAMRHLVHDHAAFSEIIRCASLAHP